MHGKCLGSAAGLSRSLQAVNVHAVLENGTEALCPSGPRKVATGRDRTRGSLQRPAALEC